MRCPVCRAEFAESPAGLRCAAGHSFDRARQGYVNLAAGLGRVGLGADDAAAVDARSTFLTAGHFAPVLDEVIAAAVQAWPHRGLVVDVGSGPGHYLAAVLDAVPADGLALDSSTPALRRAARCHPRASAIGWDLREPLPLVDGCAGLLLNVFAPRNGAEYARVLGPAGALLVVTPGPGHLGELVSSLGLISVDADKPARLAVALDPWFTAVRVARVNSRMSLSHVAVATVVGMGPNAHHIGAGELADRIAVLPDPVAVTLEVNVGVYRPRV
ncbi:MAG TPA: rRNA (guanine-N1)-methyltransferase [Sporichthyaceae bacterium]|nr:rRNA (guanine-N1)-methyltransferase [Sporichthyaceae bacterium]